MTIAVKISLAMKRPLQKPIGYKQKDNTFATAHAT